MSLIAFPFARYKRAVVAAACATAVAAVLSGTWVSKPIRRAASRRSCAKPGPVIQHIAVQGTQRIEPATVLSYVSIREGDAYDEQAVDRSLKTLFATGLFADVKFNWDGSTLTINVVENPIINQVVFEGNDKVSEKDLTKEVQIKPRTVFTRAKVQADVQRIIELYRRNGKFAATVDPQIIQRPQNRVDLIFSINEGPTTGVARISFIGNKHLRRRHAARTRSPPKKAPGGKFLSSNDNYDPDRLTFDREQLRRFYLKQRLCRFPRGVRGGGAHAGPRELLHHLHASMKAIVYKFGKVVINSKIKELDAREPAPARPHRATERPTTPNWSTNPSTRSPTRPAPRATPSPKCIRASSATTTRAPSTSSSTSTEARASISRRSTSSGNTRTLDKVIRREFRLVEGDAFNRVLVDRSRTRIKALGFFKDVDVKPLPGTQPDRTVLQVNVTEQSTGELQLGAGYSSTSSFVGQFSYTERNLFGRGQYLRASIEVSRSASRRSSASPSPSSWTGRSPPASISTRSSPITSR